MIFKSLAKGSQQYEWLKRELNSREFRKAKYKIVLMHESQEPERHHQLAREQ